jgi:hypothetical protein
MSLFDRLIEISTLEQLWLINNKLSYEEVKSDTRSEKRYRTARKYSNDPVQIKRRNL